MAFRGRGTVLIATAAPTESVDIGDAFITGGSGLAADAEHQHAFPAPAAGYAAMLAAVGADGDSTTPARANHRHAHPASDHAPGGPLDLSSAFMSRQRAEGVAAIQNQRIGPGTLLAPAENPATQKGTLNIGIGINAGANVTDGSWNVFMGPDAGWQVTTGFENVFIGIQAGIYATTGQDNTGVGTNALEGGPEGGPGGLPLGLVYNTGSYNSALGVTSGFFVKAGNENVFVGNNAGSGPAQAHPTVNGSCNTFLGRFTGPSAGDPSYTTALGANATVDGDGSVAIGVDHTGAGAAATGVDSFVLGTAIHQVAVPSGVISGSGLQMVLAAGGPGGVIALRPQLYNSDNGAVHVLNTGGLRFYDGGGTARAALLSGNGSPNGTVAGTAGDWWFRTDTPGTVNQRLYVCTGGTAWTGIL